MLRGGGGSFVLSWLWPTDHSTAVRSILVPKHKAHTNLALFKKKTVKFKNSVPGVLHYGVLNHGHGCRCIL